MDGFIVGLTFLLTTLITKNFILMTLAGLVIMIGLIFICNEVFGKVLIKRKEDKNE